MKGLLFVRHFCCLAVSAKPVPSFLLWSFNGSIHHLLRVISSIELFTSILLWIEPQKMVIVIIATHKWSVNLNITINVDHSFTASPMFYEHCSVWYSSFPLSITWTDIFLFRFTLRLQFPWRHMHFIVTLNQIRVFRNTCNIQTLLYYLSIPISGRVL